MAVIRVPKTPKSAFNKNRPASELLQRQVEHFEFMQASAAAPPAVKSVPRTRSRGPLTEGEAAAYIQAMTQRLNPAVEPQAPALQPAAPAARSATRTKRKAKATRKAKGKTRATAAKGRATGVKPRAVVAKRKPAAPPQKSGRQRSR